MGYAAAKDIGNEPLLHCPHYFQTLVINNELTALWFGNPQSYQGYSNEEKRQMNIATEVTELGNICYISQHKCLEKVKREPLYGLCFNAFTGKILQA